MLSQLVRRGRVCASACTSLPTRLRVLNVFIWIVRGSRDRVTEGSLSGQPVFLLHSLKARGVCDGRARVLLDSHFFDRLCFLCLQCGVVSPARTGSAAGVGGAAVRWSRGGAMGIALHSSARPCGTCCTVESPCCTHSYPYVAFAVAGAPGFAGATTPQVRCRRRSHVAFSHDSRVVLLYLPVALAGMLGIATVAVPRICDPRPRRHRPAPPCSGRSLRCRWWCTEHRRERHPRAIQQT